MRNLSTPHPRRGRRHDRVAPRARRALLVTAALTSLAPMAGATDTYTGPDGNWSTGSNWSLGAPPGNNETVILQGIAGGTNTITFDAPAATAPNLASVSIGRTNAAATTLLQSSGSIVVGTMTLGVGGGGLANSGLGYVSLSGGQEKVQFLYIGGTSSAGTCTFTLSGSGQLTAVNEGVSAFNGAGKFVQTGGTHTATTLNVGSAEALGASSYDLSGGTLKSPTGAFGTASGSLTVAAGRGTGRLNMTGGSVAFGQISVGNFGDAGTFTLNGGAVRAANETVGGTLALFAHSSGSNNADTLAVSSGTYALSGTGWLTVGGTATISYGSGIGGFFAQSGGTANMAGLSLGGGTVTLSGGNLFVTMLGRSSSNGSFTMSGGLLSTTTSDFSAIAYVQSGGTHVTSSLKFGLQAALKGGLLNAGTSQVTLTNPFTQSGGTFRADAGLNVGSRTTYALSGPSLLDVGVLDVDGSLDMRSAGPSTAVNVSGTAWVGGGDLGTVTNSAGTFTTGRLVLGGNVPGTFTLSGTGSLTAANIDVGYSEHGTLNQSAGTVVASTMTLGALPGGTGTYVTYTGTIGTYTLPTGTGTCNLTGGTLSTTSLYVGGSATSSGGVGALLISGGTATTSLLRAYGRTGSRVSLSAGALSADSFINDSPYTQTGGSATLGPVSGTGSISVSGAARPTLAVTRLNQSALSIGSGGAVRVAADPLNVQTNTAAVTLTGTGTLDLNDQDLLTPTAATTIQSYLASGYTGGAWNGTNGGIISTAAATSSAPRSLAYASSTDLTARTIPAGQTLVTYTVPGDADLSGAVDFNDFLALQNGYGTTGDWAQGDFNYDGIVDYSDYLILQSDYGLSLAGGAVTAAPYLAPVPEPASLSFLALGAAAMLTRRRSRPRRQSFG